jgi:ribosomal protein S18 acetylase RimI-like enzyme
MAEILELPRLQLRRGRPEDANAAAELLHAAWHQTYDRILPPQLTAPRTRDRFSDEIAQGIGGAWLAWLGSRLVGYMKLTANCVDQLWVAPWHQRRGVGSRLLEQALTDFQAAGYQGVQAGCEDFNQAACSFFERQGWDLIGSEPQRLAPGLTIDALVYSRRLAAAGGA